MATAMNWQFPQVMGAGGGGGGSSGGINAADRAMLQAYMDPNNQMQQQSAANRDYAALNAEYNRYNTVGPTGSTTWSQQGGGDIDWDAYSKANAAYNDEWAHWGDTHHTAWTKPRPQPEDFKKQGTWTETSTLTPESQAALDSFLKYQTDATNKLYGGNQLLAADQESWSKAPSEYAGIKAPNLSKYYKDVNTNVPDYYKNINVNKTTSAAMKAWNNVQQASGATATAGQAADTWGGVDTSGVGRGSESIRDFIGSPELDYQENYKTNYADIGADEAVRQQVIDALNARMQPQLNADEKAMQSQMINMGVRPGTNVYGQQQQLFNQQKNDARMAAIQSGGVEMQRQVEMEKMAQQQGLAQARQNQDIFNELWGQKDTLASQRQKNQYDLFNVDYQNKALQAQEQIAKAQGQGEINMANAGNTTQANIASANNQTQASITNAQTSVARASGISDTVLARLNAKLAKAEGRTDRKVTINNQQLALASALASAGALTYEQKMSLANARMNEDSNKTAQLIALQKALAGQ